MPNLSKPAVTDYPIHDLLAERWSPIAFAETLVEPVKLLSLFEAARWSASSRNEQPWAFVVGTKEDDPVTYDRIFDALVPANQVWAKTAPVLVVSLARRQFEQNGNENFYALYDTGQAIANLIVEATAQGLYVHQMGGFDQEKMKANLAIPDTYLIGAALTIGYLGDSSVLEEKYQERHNNPARARRPLSSSVLTASGEFGTASPLLETT